MWNSIFKTYAGADATLEIVVMLLGMFLLGVAIAHLYAKHLYVCKNNNLVNKKKKRVSVDGFNNNDGNDFILMDDESDLRRISEKSKTNVVNRIKNAELEQKKDLVWDGNLLKEEQSNDLLNNIPLNSSADNGDFKTKDEVEDKIIVKEGDQKETPNNISSYLSSKYNFNNFSEKQKEEYDNINDDFRQEDDFKLIEGIGPKIDALLKQAGIKTYKDLSMVKVDSLKRILRELGGDRYAFHDPTS